jgi:hypothetical protein
MFGKAIALSRTISAFSILLSGGFIITEKRPSQPGRLARSKPAWQFRDSLRRKQSRLTLANGPSLSGRPLTSLGS